MAKRKSEAFDVSLSDSERAQLADDWCTDIDDAFSHRSRMIADGGLIDLYDWFYEQGQSDPGNRPFPGAADLTSYIFTVNIDAMRSRLMQAVFKAEPFCLVDGWGEDAKKAPLVESFHEWQVEEEGLETELSKVCHGALIEDGYILEVRERIETRRTTEEVELALELREGAAVFDESGQPMLRVDPETGEHVLARDGEPSARVKRVYTKTKRLGPEYDAISMKDFVYLPGHAKNMRQVYGYAYRFWQRIPELTERVEDQVYDAAAVKALGDTSDRDEARVPSTVDGVASTTARTAEKELFQLSVKTDLDKDGREEWYLVTLSLKNRVILRIKLDTFVQRVGKPRCVPFVLFPRRDSVYGYAYAGDKLLTLAEEHTALRNMTADRSALATNAPMTVLQGAAWDPETQPLGVGRTITVRDHNEIRQLQIADVPQSVVFLMRDVMSAKESVGGLSDVAQIGSGDRSSQTLGQDQLVASASAVRVDEPLGHFRKAIATVMELRHAIWIDTLRQDTRGIEAPASTVQRLDALGTSLVGGRFTADMLDGRFRFKPYGSVDTADNNIRMMYFNQGFQALGGMMKMFPGMAAILNDPAVWARMLQEWGRVYKIRDVGVFMKALQNLQQQQMGQLPGAGGMNPGAPGAPPPGPPRPPGPPGPPPPPNGAPAPPPGGAPPAAMQQLMAMMGGRGVQ